MKKRNPNGIISYDSQPGYIKEERLGGGDYATVVNKELHFGSKHTTLLTGKEPSDIIAAKIDEFFSRKKARKLKDSKQATSHSTSNEQSKPFVVTQDKLGQHPQPIFSVSIDSSGSSRREEVDSIRAKADSLPYFTTNINKQGEQVYIAHDINISSEKDLSHWPAFEMPRDSDYELVSEFESLSPKSVPESEVLDTDTTIFVNVLPVSPAGRRRLFIEGFEKPQTDLINDSTNSASNSINPNKR